MGTEEFERKWKAKFTRAAEDDLKSILKETKKQFGPEQGKRLLGEFEQIRKSLEAMPFRCDPPEELKKLNVFLYREIHLRPFRILSEPDNAAGIVHIHVILHSRRNIPDILNERLFLDGADD